MKKQAAPIIFKYLIAFLLTVFSSSNHLFAIEKDGSEKLHATLLTGIYLLKGSNPNSEKINYHGAVAIEELGDNYLITWGIGSSQFQVGIGILKDHILSVAFYDENGNGSGVVSYCLTGPGKLEGSWAHYPSESSGKEFLTYLRPSELTIEK